MHHKKFKSKMGNLLIDYCIDNYYMAFYCIALFLSLKKYRHYFNSILRFLPVLIAYAILSELLGYLIVNYDSFQIVTVEKYSYANNGIFNIYDIVFFLFFYYVFFEALKIRLYKSLIICGVLLYLLTCLVNPFFEDFLIFPQIFASGVGSLLLIFCIFGYFYELKKGTHTPNILLVWISIGLLIFNLFIPFILYLGIYNLPLYEELNLRQIHHLLIAALYTCWIIGFINIRQTTFNKNQKQGA